MDNTQRACKERDTLAYLRGVSHIPEERFAGE